MRLPNFIILSPTPHFHVLNKCFCQVDVSVFKISFSFLSVSLNVLFFGLKKTLVHSLASQSLKKAFLKLAQQSSEFLLCSVPSANIEA